VSAELTRGAVVGGKYRLERLIAEGGMGVLWSASLTADQGPPRFALKLLKGGDDVDATLRRRMLREARAVGAAHHRNVVAIHEVIELADGSPALVMDLLEGESLRARLARERTLPLGEAARLMLQVIAGVESAHALGIVHRDLKPENVFLARAEGGTVVKVLDFGIAKLTAWEGGAAQTEALTSTGALLGTPYYMAPEQVVGEAIDRRTDVWALGVLLYECLTGVRPVEDENLGKVLRRILIGALRPLAAAAPELPAELVRLVDRMLAFEREDRPADLAEVRAVLDRFTSSPLPALPPAPPEAPSSMRSARHEAEAPTLAAAPQPEAVPEVTPTEPAPPTAPVTPAPAHRGRRALALGLGAAAALGAAALFRTRARPAPLPEAAVVSSPRCPAGMVLVPGGEMRMGTDDGADDEGPVHAVTVGDVCMDRTEVTVTAYVACEAAGRCRPAASSVDYGALLDADRQFESTLCTGATTGKERHPINCVTWMQADAFCRAAGARLPTEVEWEYAAGGGPEHRRYAWGSAPPGPALLNACDSSCAAYYARAGREHAPMFAGDDGFPTTAPVGSYPAGRSRDGLEDMTGNVWEWTASPYCPYPAHTCDSPYRVFRGGGFSTTLAHRERVTTRFWSAPQYRYMDVGFRCARDAAPP
jgi:serine/threonine-protein kinase